MTCRWIALALITLLAVGCAGSRQTERPPDDRYGHRFAEGQAPDVRRTVTLAEPDDAFYFTYPIVIDSLHIRQGAFIPYLDAEIQRVAVEVLVKGVYPDNCSDISELSQRRVGHIIEVDLLMRKPQDTVCFRVRRPFRYYFELDGSFRPGFYTLKLNGQVRSFQVRPQRR